MCIIEEKENKFEYEVWIEKANNDACHIEHNANIE